MGCHIANGKKNGHKRAVEGIELYGGQVRLEFDPNKHKYFAIDGDSRKECPSVTKITSIVDKSGPLMGWAVNQTVDYIREGWQPDLPFGATTIEQILESAKSAHTKRKKAAANVGSSVHYYLEHPVSPSEAPEELKGYLEAAFHFLEASSISPRAAERKLYSRVCGYAGTMDFLGQDVEGNINLVDWKTSPSIYPEFLLQTAAYAKAIEEEDGTPIDKRILVTLRADGTYEPHEFSSREGLEADFMAFKCALGLYTRMQSLNKLTRKANK